MRKMLLRMLCALALSLFGCGGNGGRYAAVRGIDSEIYTRGRLSCGRAGGDAGFRDFQGCTLTEISYAGDETVQKEQEYILSFGDYDEGIVLLSSFTVDEHGGDGSLEPNHTYTRWSWYLARKNGGKVENRNQRLWLNTIVKSPLLKKRAFVAFILSSEQPWPYRQQRQTRRCPESPSRTGSCGSSRYRPSSHRS